VHYYRIKTIIFDKTGTLTVGKPTLTNLVLLHSLPSTKYLSNKLQTKVHILDMIVESNNIPIYDEIATEMLLNQCNQNETIESPKVEKYSILLKSIHDSVDRILKVAASAESCSQHPLAMAILKAVDCRNENKMTEYNNNVLSGNIVTNVPNLISLYVAEENSFALLNGMGIQLATCDGIISVGNRALMTKIKATLPTHVENIMWKFESQGRTVVCVAVNDILLGLLVIADMVKPEASQTIGKNKLRILVISY
jgi:cation transport ATPase